MSGRNGIAGRRGGREAASAPVSDAREGGDMDAKDNEAVYELERMYLRERKHREDAEAELLAERAAHAETRERCAEALRLARAGVTLAADTEARRQQAEAEKRGAMETVQAVGAKGKRKKRNYERGKLKVEETVFITNSAGVKTPEGKQITIRWIRAVESGHIKTPSWYPGRNVTAEQMANRAKAEAQRQSECPDVTFVMGERALAEADARRARRNLRTGYHG